MVNIAPFCFQHCNGKEKVVMCFLSLLLEAGEILNLLPEVNISHAVKVTLGKTFVPMFYIRTFALTSHVLRPSLN